MCDTGVVTVASINSSVYVYAREHRARAEYLFVLVQRG